MKIFKKINQRFGFSLMEVNMAVFVMAVGILSMIALYPLGLRESTQGQADLKQSMLAEYMLNQAVGIASQKEITWSEWKNVVTPNYREFPKFNGKSLHAPGWSDAPNDNQYRMICGGVPNTSGKIMGIMVQSTDLTDFTDYNQYSNNPIYYAEVMFQGKPPDNGQL